MEAAGKAVAIPPKSDRRNPRLYHKLLHRTCHLIENSFDWIKQFRRIATRYDKTARNFLAAFQMVAVLHWLN